MTSQAQMASNRKNARLSTGPRTPEGKAVSSQNALRHGALSTQVILPDEDPEAFAALSQQVTAQLAPDGPVDDVFVERAIVSIWRLRRAVRMETAVIAQRTREATVALAESQRGGDPLAVAVIRDATGADTLSKLSRYETTHERALYRALHELERRQAARHGQAVAPPAVIDLEISTPTG